ncbi:26S proteasome regulatory subunit 6B [Galemys pyrenaicus]|uniref:26S proteasome regulatory subunit 6B n=1 Tax=Galemys pyrenaicus TaxID=202257 RepID=A0A8J6DM40_GALPY|nr:26S proteasome regulatory subunit 6B [Galemys pyrenaicus]
MRRKLGMRSQHCLHHSPADLSFQGPKHEDLKDLHSYYMWCRKGQEGGQKKLKKESLHAQEEVKGTQDLPLVVGQLLPGNWESGMPAVGRTNGCIVQAKDLEKAYKFIIREEQEQEFYK